MSAASDKAVAYVLTRIRQDKDLAHLMLFTEAFALLCVAYSETSGQDVDEVEALMSKSVARYPRRFFSLAEIEDALGGDKEALKIRRRLEQKLETSR